MAKPHRPKRDEPTDEDLKTFVLVHDAVANSGASSYRVAIRECRENEITLNGAKITRALQVIEKYLGIDNGVLLDRRKGAAVRAAGRLSSARQTTIAVRWAQGELAHRGGQLDLVQTPATNPNRPTIRITTENFLAVHLLPAVIADFIPDPQDSEASVAVEVRECSTLLAGLDDHLRNDTDFLIHTVRRSSDGGRGAMPKIEGIKIVDFTNKTGFSLRDAVWIPTTNEFRDLLRRDPIERRHLESHPVAFVDFPGAAKLLRGPKVTGARVLVETNENMMKFVLSKKFVGIGHNWRGVVDRQFAKRVKMVRFQTTRPEIRIGVFHRRNPMPSELVNRFLSDLETYLKKAATGVYQVGTREGRMHAGPDGQEG